MPSPSRNELLPGLKRFNRWQFTEAHSAWRELAEQTEGSDREFLLALSSIAAGFAKIWHKGGEPHAMVSLLTQGINDLQGFLPRWMDVELEPFNNSLLRCLEESKRWRRGDTEIFNRDLIPRLEFSPRSDLS
ncbi:MAG: hypothetical protein JW797_04655 [Bradymonadales bacterium]|nr:hypothetical protein [Bradymonadales bacterium]